jgi:hypothetical protein
MIQIDGIVIGVIQAEKLCVNGNVILTLREKKQAWVFCGFK